MEFNINSLNHINDGNINHVNYDLGDNSNNFDKVRCIKMMISNLTEYIILLFSFMKSKFINMGHSQLQKLQYAIYLG